MSPRAVLLAVSLGIATLACAAQTSGTTPFVLNGNRIYAKVDLVLPDGSSRPAYAYVDMGSPSMMLTDTLFKELGIGAGRPLRFKVGALTVEVPVTAIDSERFRSRRLGAVLAAGVLQHYEVVIDYCDTTLTLAQPGSLTPQGIAVPFQLDSVTGLIAVNATISGRTYAITIDNGSAYTWVRQRTAADWLHAHPAWERGTGAVGTSNMMMLGDSTETMGALMRIPSIAIGSLTLMNVGVLAAGTSHGFPGGLELFDWYSKKNAVPVIGWIGGNVLKGFQLTVDYAHRTMYWLRQTAPDSLDQDQVGITLRTAGGGYFVAAIATKNGKPTVSGVLIGDRVIQIGALETARATPGDIYDALHGKPGEPRVLILERDGAQVTVTAYVTAF